MFSQILHANRLVRAGTDMQGHGGRLDALCAQTIEQGIVKVQTGRGGGDRPRVLGKHRLVTGFVRLGRAPVDVRGQGQGAVGFGVVDHAAVRGEAQVKEIALAAQNFHLESLCQAQRHSRLGRLAGAHLSDGLVLAHRAFDQDLDLPTGGLLAEQAGVDHAGVVEHQQILVAQV